ncbi:MAG TPA: branched-chain amino acid ABC transporter permease [Ktedonobacterales bacterium]|jgi:branched-chain amino acid transport system permease protein|nr:branched-chain amino acid ABC transporter permease [Ktedonobacterales bacterium]
MPNAQILVNWLLIGSFYAAVALGFSLVWGIMNIVNLAHGSLLILGAYVAYFAFTALHLNPFIGIILAMLALFVVGWLIQYIAINRVIRAPLLVTFMLTFGLDLLITNLAQQFFTANNRAINSSLAGVNLTLGATVIPVQNVLAALIAVLLTAALSLFLARTRTGNAILAVGMDRDAARLMGINIARTYALTFALGAALAGAAGAMLAMTLQFQPVDAGQYTLFAFVIVALGGLGTPWGALAGGLLFGLATTLSGSIQAIGPGLQTTVAFAVLVLVLVLRPRGVLGKAFYS